MAIEDIVEKIKREAEAEAKRISGEADDKREEILAEAEDYAGNSLKKAKTRAESEAEKTHRQVLSRERARLRKELLAKKQEMVSKIFDRGKKAVIEQDPDRLRGIYAEMVESFDEESGKIIVGSKDAETLGEQFMDMLKDRIGGDFEREVSDRFERGLMLISGKVQYDARLDSLYAQLVENYTDEVAAILFGDSGEDS